MVFSDSLHALRSASPSRPYHTSVQTYTRTDRTVRPCVSLVSHGIPRFCSSGIRPPSAHRRYRRSYSKIPVLSTLFPVPHATSHRFPYACSFHLHRWMSQPPPHTLLWHETVRHTHTQAPFHPAWQQDMDTMFSSAGTDR